MSPSGLQPPESYSKDDVQEILHLAIARKTDVEELSRAQLWEIAAELDIDYESLQAAEQDWLKGKVLRSKRQEFDQYRREQLKQKAIRYGIINSFLIMLNFLSSGTLSWSLYIVIILGLPLTLNAWNTFQIEGEAYEQAFQRWSLKKEMKESISTLWDKIKKAWQS
ncbi:conserved hypothetical protein [Rippkaea orientalis PCC 8801]|uniref:2TM domain-containing protein n=1 Tax=Rippkaea orientalis (strain PCC 8801 / RF-1) TaxID=41431 RepID=B7K3Z4_RIPO1|nr:2TM domain-containing protein [Rippkaea orientalis]ACK66534.1 conserved hypothetical protein [Rippkaea orientalis PCC 8801]